MPRYFFNLNDGQKIIPDPEGTMLPDHDSARAHAGQVVQELARNRERKTKTWRLVVRDEKGILCFELPFEAMDTLNPSIGPVMRAMAGDAGHDTASPNDTIERLMTPHPHTRKGIAVKGS
jgi:hypothetical protein